MDENKYMKGSSTSLVIKELHIKTTIRMLLDSYFYGKHTNSDNTKCWQGCGITGTVIISENTDVPATLETAWQILIKLHIHLPSTQQSPFLVFTQRK